MKSAQKILLIPIIVLLLIFGVSFSASAASDPKLDYALIYKALSNSNLEITYDLNMSFNTKGSSVSAFVLNVAESDIANVKVQSDRGVSATTKKNDQGSQITLNFPENKRLLAGQKTNIKLIYETKSAIKTRGEVTDIIVTGFQKDDSINSIKVQVEIPNSIGRLDYSSVENPKETTNKSGGRVYSFDNLPESGIVISFGQHQNYKFTFNYLIKNSSDAQNQLASITIPYEDEYQKLRFKKANPSPYKAYEDIDGNYILQYLLKPGETIDVVIEGYATIYSKSGEKTTEVKTLTEAETIMYTKPLEYWTIEAKNIDEKFSSQVNNEKNTDKKAKLIFDYVVSKLTYSEDQLSNKDRKRLGAESVLKNPKIAICQEYSDLFVGLARYFGVPSRSIAGYAYPTTGYELPPNTLHSWAQYFNPDKGWVDVDPTWQDTSNGLDYFGSIGLNHFPIAIYGQDSKSPPLVLSFVPEEDNSDNLQIEPVDDASVEKDLTKTIDKNDIKMISLQTKDKLFSGIQSDSQLIINNVTNEILKDIAIVIDENTLILDSEDKDIIVLPNSTYQIPITLEEKNWLFNGDKEFNIKINATVLGKPYSDETTVTQKFISPLFSGPMFVFVIAILVIAASTIIAIPLFKRIKTELKIRKDNPV